MTTTIKTDKGTFIFIQIPESSTQFEIKEFDRYGDSLWVNNKPLLEGCLELGCSVLGTSLDKKTLEQVLDESSVFYNKSKTKVFYNYGEIGKSFFLQPEDSFQSLINKTTIKKLPVLILKKAQI